MVKKIAVTNQTVDPAVEMLLGEAEALGVSTAFSRAAAMAPCPIGEDGRCCKNCHMGPCRLVKPGQRGVCGATLETVAARNLARAIAAGAAAHSDHGLDMAFTLEAVARGEAPGYEIGDPHKLRSVAGLMGIQADARPVNDLALEVAERAIENFRQMRGELTYVSRAPAKRQEIWRGLGITPRSVTREIVETLHRTHVGTDQDPEHILRHALRTALSDGWGGSMLATDISDILFGTPSPTVAQVNLGVLKNDEVNIVIHGHEPTLSEMIVAAAQSPEMADHARSKGAAGINLCGICCTANEILMRQGVAVAGNFLSQELALLTGAVEAMVVDVQCIMQALGDLSSRFHTRLITTSPKADITGATHIEFDEHHAPEIARQIVRLAVDNFPNRNGRVTIPQVTNDLVPGFSHEYINYMQGGSYRGSFRPLNDAVVAGRIRGAAGVVGCNNPRTTHDETHIYLVREFLKNDVLVVMTGCGAIANAKCGMLLGEAMEYAGPGLREVCEAIGIPPVLHLGSCVDNSRILTVLTQMATEGGLGEDIADLPVVGFAPEWMSEKALSIGTYFVASGVYTIFGVGSPVGGSEEVTRLIGEGWEKQVGARLEFEPDREQMLAKALAHIDAKRAALKLAPYDPSRFGASGDRRLRELMALPLEERAAALYGRA
ncbi:MAG: anaerobic carbon-monoxide dehydrogenase catalytic subunit [Anaerolineae bacterium]|jgi:carbon-monoxide dehydrogenase catalytic subunit